MDRTMEKLQLAEEIGMNAWKVNKLQEIKILEEINDLTKIQLKPISEQEIENKLTKRYWAGWTLIDENGEKNIIYCFCIPFIAFVTCGFCEATLINLPNYSSNFGFIKFAFWISLINFLIIGICRYKECIISKISLNKWTDNIPYGALLAVKEAKERGLDNFQIYYPTLNYDRIMTDPIITGTTKNGLLVEIFYWDDSKIYE